MTGYVLQGVLLTCHSSCGDLLVSALTRVFPQCIVPSSFGYYNQLAFIVCTIHYKQPVCLRSRKASKFGKCKSALGGHCIRAWVTANLIIKNNLSIQQSKSWSRLSRKTWQKSESPKNVVVTRRERKICLYNPPVSLCQLSAGCW